MFKTTNLNLTTTYKPYRITPENATFHFDTELPVENHSASGELPLKPFLWIPGRGPCGDSFSTHVSFWNITSMRKSYEPIEWTLL